MNHHYNGLCNLSSGSFQTCIGNAAIPTVRHNKQSATTKRPFAGGKKSQDKIIDLTQLGKHCQLFAGYI